MAVDFQVAFPQQSVVLNDIRVIDYEGLKALRIVGDDFRAVDEVVVNDEPSPDVIVVSRNELIAQIPDSQQSSLDVRSVMVLTNEITLSARSLIRFRIGRTPGKVRGILRLMQLFLKILFTTPGTDIFNRSLGGGALRNVGATYSKNEGSNLVTDIVVAVNRTQGQIVAMQAKDSRSQRDERLLSARVIGSRFDKTQGGLYVSIEIRNQANKVGIANVET